MLKKKLKFQTTVYKTKLFTLSVSLQQRKPELIIIHPCKLFPLISLRLLQSFIHLNNKRVQQFNPFTRAALCWWHLYFRKAAVNLSNASLIIYYFFVKPVIFEKDLSVALYPLALFPIPRIEISLPCLNTVLNSGCLLPIYTFSGLVLIHVQVSGRSNLLP